MLIVAVIFLVLVVVMVLGFGITLMRYAQHHTECRGAEERLKRRVLEADHRLSVAHRQARRAMNDAAGQSWRNLTE